MARLAILGVTVDVDGPPQLLEELMAEYPQPPGGPAVHRLCWSGLQCHIDGNAVMAPVATPALLPVVTEILLRRLVAAHHPGLLLLHGNALWRDGSLLAFLGASGSGKSTLSWELFADSRTALLAEDMIAIDTRRGQILPHPRASRLKHGSTVAFRPAPRFHAEPTPLSQARIVFLQADSATNPATPADEMSLSAWPPGVAAHLREQAPDHTVVMTNGVPQLRWAQSLDRAQAERLTAELESRGVLVLSRGRSAMRDRFVRPAAPSLRLLEARESIRLAIDNLIPPAPASGAALVMLMARTLASCRCLALTPGGTPGQTASALLEVCDAA